MSESNDISAFAEQYIGELKETLDEISQENVQTIVDVIYDAYRNNKQVFIMGNGGSASISSHFACDLGKGTIMEGKSRFRVMSLNDNIALITALSNDFGYDCVFKEQLINLVSEGDIVIAITGSGNSPNILEAMRYAESRHATTIGLIGFGGGKLKEMVDYEITVNNHNYGQVEDVHLILEHMICQFFKYRFERE
jgi:D-sedoheptulose 7-phosphate isomerase